MSKSKKWIIAHKNANIKRKLSNKMAYEINPRLRENLSQMWSKEKSNFWNGGKSFEKYNLEWTNILKSSIRKRDKEICQLCKIHQDSLDYLLHVHHIDYNKNNCNPDNLIALCRNCHMGTNFNRPKWIKLFKKHKEV